ncbi:hypothetical protein [Paraburkholderia humisilvae]|uniref:Uncharacterized protein n=1 Tax=Paraburkholderia humisilvae TaxID=627669 RepID=A0A6J5FCQ0_9BURK|nr:hypothetical protein [Paraburkholderia humisilvae]CAB3775005.1 hypothetical protein LMG29542_08387 [Paraburkholderia humisilvae]
MFTGVYNESASSYAMLQTGGAVMTVLVLMFVAHSHTSPKVSGIASYLLIVAGGLLTAWISIPFIYSMGFMLVVGFEKMFNVFIRSSRQKLIPKEDFGKTVGFIVMLNNLTQPLAGGGRLLR